MPGRKMRLLYFLPFYFDPGSQTGHMQIMQRYILQIYEVRREAYETVRDSFRPCVAGGRENERMRERRKRERIGRDRERERKRVREEGGWETRREK